MKPYRIYRAIVTTVLTVTLTAATPIGAHLRSPQSEASVDERLAVARQIPSRPDLEQAWRQGYRDAALAPNQGSVEEQRVDRLLDGQACENAAFDTYVTALVEVSTLDELESIRDRMAADDPTRAYAMLNRLLAIAESVFLAKLNDQT